MNSLDPRIKRLDLKKTEDGEAHTNSHLITWEVFHQEKRGKQVVHVGIVHAPNPEMALVMAKEVFGRRGKTTNLWIAKTSEVYTFSSEDEEMFETTPEKMFRDPAYYKVRDRIEKNTKSKQNFDMNTNALKDLLFKMADDALIIGHRNSEWTGIGPMLEEDLAFSSMAQDKIGHAQALYKILNEILGEADPDTLGFKREEKQFRCCQFLELPIGEYDFSIIRHFLFDHAELIRYDMLTQSTFTPLAQLAKKVKGEIKYHVMHADTFVKQLGNGTEESHARLQTALNNSWHAALGIFEKGEFENDLIKEGIFGGEEELRKRWLERITPILESANLKVAKTDEGNIVNGGRKGFHSEYLKPLLDEMCEVVRTDVNAEW